MVVWADGFRYSKHSTVNRARIKTVAGPAWLTVPVLTTGRSAQAIHEIKIDQEHHWRQTHLRSLHVNYQNSPYYEFFTDDLRTIIQPQSPSLNGLLLKSLYFLMKKIRLDARVVNGNELPKTLDRSKRVAAWLEACQCNDYLCLLYTSPSPRDPH